MLVIRRKTSQSFVLQVEGKTIATITYLNTTIKQGEQVAEVANGQAKIGIDADPSVTILRSELVDDATFGGTRNITGK